MGGWRFCVLFNHFWVAKWKRVAKWVNILQDKTPTMQVFNCTFLLFKLPRYFLKAEPLVTSQTTTSLSLLQETNWLLSQEPRTSRTSWPWPRYVFSNTCSIKSYFEPSTTDKICQWFSRLDNQNDEIYNTFQNVTIFSGFHNLTVLFDPQVRQ